MAKKLKLPFSQLGDSGIIRFDLSKVEEHQLSDLAVDVVIELAKRFNKAVPEVLVEDLLLSYLGQHPDPNVRIERIDASGNPSKEIFH